MIGLGLGFSQSKYAFSPMLYHPAYWFRLDAGLTLNAGNVQALATYRGPAFAASQATPANQPGHTAIDASFNNHATMTVDDATPKFLDNTADKLVPQSSPRTLFFVARATDTIGGTLLDFLSNAANPDSAFQWLDLFGLRFIYGNAAVNLLIDAPPPIQNVTYYLTIVDKGTGVTPVFRANGTGYVISGAATMPAEGAGTGFTLGRRTAFGQGFTGRTADFLGYAYELSIAQYKTVERMYLKPRYAL